MKRLFAVAFFCTLGAIGSPATAAPQCSEAYTVVAGDTLSKIARAAYQDPNLWPYIYGYSANATTIGGDPGLISIGISLDMPPCPQTGQRAATAPIENDRGLRTATTVEVVTGTDYPPFTDQTWENGGMLTEVVDAALSMAEGTPDYSIDWINDWASHIDPLLERHKYDMGFPGSSRIATGPRIWETRTESAAASTSPSRCSTCSSSSSSAVTMPVSLRKTRSFMACAFAVRMVILPSTSRTAA